MTDNVQYIVNYIRGQLTGDYEKDMSYLHECGQKYKDDEEGPEILQEIATMMYAILPEEEKSQVSAHLGELGNGIEDVYNQAKKALDEERYKDALDGLDQVIAAVRDRYVTEDDDNVYVSLNHVMELYEYSYYYKTDKNIKTTDVMYNEYYRSRGLALLNLGRTGEAVDACLEALKWNPVDLESYLVLAECYLAKKDYGDYLATTRKAYRYCCTRATMARYYRNMGRYYLDKYEPRIARAMYVYANIYFQNDGADSALSFIESALQEKTPEYTIKELQSILDENNVEPGPDADTIGIIYRVGQLMLESDDYERAKDCFAICYDITQDEETGRLLQQLVGKVE